MLVSRWTLSLRKCKKKSLERGILGGARSQPVETIDYEPDVYGDSVHLFYMRSWMSGRRSRTSY